MIHAVARSAGGTHSAQKQVIDPAHVLTVVITTHALTQIAMQRQHIKQILQIIAAIEDGLAQFVGRVVFKLRAQQITLVVGDVVTPLVLEYQIDDAGNHAAKIFDSDRTQRHTDRFVEEAVKDINTDMLNREIKLQFVQALAA